MDELVLRTPADEAGADKARPRSRGAHRANGAVTSSPAAPRSGRGRSRRAKGRHRRILPDRPFWQEVPLLILIAVGVAFVVKTFILQVFFIPSISMENTLLRDDRVLVEKVTYRFNGNDVQRGQVVVFNAEGILAPDTPTEDPSGNAVTRAARSFAAALGLAQSGETDYIKRVIGVGGDRVACCDDDGRVTVNGVPLDESAYLYPGDVPSTTPFDVIVPEGSLWVMGDHRSASQDSRSRLGAPGGGFVPVDRVVGRAFVVSWPLSNISRLPVPDTFSQEAIQQQEGTIP